MILSMHRTILIAAAATSLTGALLWNGNTDVKRGLVSGVRSRR